MSFDSASLEWFLVQLKPNSLTIAQRNLRRQKFQTFCPLIEVTVKRRNKFVTADQPLFPGYIFVATDTRFGQWKPIRSTYGVSHIVAFGETPAAVPRALIHELKARCDDTGKLMAPEAFEIGETVCVATGPFADFIGEIERIDADRRVWLLIDMMNRKKRVSTQADNLRKAP